MKTRNIITIVLLAFVGASVVYLVIGEVVVRRAPGDKPDDGIACGPASRPAADADTPPPDQLIAYYFHRTQRCKTCLAIERYAKESLEESFPEALASGELQWRVVNVEEPAYEHFVADFELASSAVVLVDMHDGKRVGWRNLEQVWDLVGDELKFKTYVAAEAMALLGGVE